MMQAVFVALAIAFAAGAFLILAGKLNPRTRAAARDLWPLYGSEFVIVGALLVPAFLGPSVFAVALIAFVLRGQFELFRLVGLPAFGLPQGIAGLAAAAMIVAAEHGALRAGEIALAAGAALSMLTGLATRPGRAGFVLGLVAAGGLAFPALMAAAAAWLAVRPNGVLWLVFAYGTVEINDAFALLIGKLFGRTPAFPRLSPRKTLEGLLGGIGAGLLAGLLLAHALLRLGVSAALAPAGVVLIAGIAGDLATSALKRRFGKKDFAPVLARHGGVLDIYDSILFAAPALALYLTAITSSP